MKLPVLRSERLVLRPIEDRDVEPLKAIVNASEWWGTPADRDDVLHDGNAFVIRLEMGDAIVGWLGVTEEPTPEYRYAALDIVLAPAYQDRGLGPEALRTTIEWLVSQGHHRFTIDPAVRNSRAIKAYTKVGFKPVGVMRKCERGRDGTWHDGLLMDLLAEEL
jgi:aminoglycoside 6'-N-acetyltransferase